MWQYIEELCTIWQSLAHILTKWLLFAILFLASWTVKYVSSGPHSSEEKWEPTTTKLFFLVQTTEAEERGFVLYPTPTWYDSVMSISFPTLLHLIPPQVERRTNRTHQWPTSDSPKNQNQAISNKVIPIVPITNNTHFIKIIGWNLRCYVVHHNVSFHFQLKRPCFLFLYQKSMAVGFYSRTWAPDHRNSTWKPRRL